MNRFYRMGPAVLLVILLLGACQAESEPETAVIPTAAEAAESSGQPSETPAGAAAPRPQATEPPAPDNAVEPTVSALLPTLTPVEPAPTEPVPTTPPTEIPPAESGFGMVDGTFYRGSANAPVRLIDYSDFL